MKKMVMVTTLLVVGALAAGCAERTAVEQKQDATTAAQLDKAKVETREAAQAIQNYSYAQKVNFIDEMKKQLVTIQEELDLLSAKVDRSNSAAKADAKAKLDAVRGEWVLAKKQLDEAESANESTWDDVKNGFKKSYDALKNSFDNARQWLSDKIEP